MQQAGRAVDNASWSWEGLSFEVVKTPRYSVLSSEPPSAPLFSFLTRTAPWAADNVFSFCSQKDLRNVGAASRKLLQLSPFRTPRLVELFGWPSSLDPGALRHLKLSEKWIDDFVEHLPRNNKLSFLDQQLPSRLLLEAQECEEWNEHQDNDLISVITTCAGSIEVLKLYRNTESPVGNFYTRASEKVGFPALQSLLLVDKYIQDISFLGKSPLLRSLNLTDCYRVEDIAVLAELRELRNVSLLCTAVADLSPLEVLSGTIR